MALLAQVQDNLPPRNVVVVDNQTPKDPWQIAIDTVSEGSGAIVAVLAVLVFFSRNKLGRFAESLIELLQLLKVTTQKNTETLERVSENDAKITETLQKHQETIAQMSIDAPAIKGKQDDQIARLKYAVKLLEYNANLILEISRSLRIDADEKPLPPRDIED